VSATQTKLARVLENVIAESFEEGFRLYIENRIQTNI